MVLHSFQGISLAELMSDHLQLDDETASMLENAIEDDAENNLY